MQKESPATRRLSLMIIILVFNLIPLIEAKAQSYDFVNDSLGCITQTTDSVIHTVLIPTPPAPKRPKKEKETATAPVAMLMSSISANGLTHIPTSYTIGTDKFVGEIPISSAVLSIGAVTYTVPIEGITGRNNLQPNISLSYNSMAGNGIAGVGWGIGGLSSINRVPFNKYYDNKASGVDMTASCPFVIDGMRLVKKTYSGSKINFEAEQGNMRIEATYSGNTINYFTVYYPNGNKAIYGFTGNTNPQLVYPLTKLIDPLGNYIEYLYTLLNENYRLDEINYGASLSGSHFGKIKFDYKSRSDISFRYEAGKEIKQEILLDKVTTSTNGTTLRTYTLTYQSGNMSLLNQIDCQVQGNSLNPLKFYYGYDNPTGTFQTNNSPLFSYFNNVPITVSKGKFDYGTEDDALIVYPTNKMEIYYKPSTLFSHSVKYYYSNTSPDQDLLIYQYLNDPYGTFPVKIKAGNGFIKTFAANINTNPQDEVIKINSNAVNGYDKVTFTTYVSNLYSGLALNSTVDFNLDPVTHVDTKGIWPKEYFAGDFTGDGKQEILAIAMYAPLDQTDKNSKCYLIDLNSNVKLFDGFVFNYNFSNNLVTIIDFDGDGKSDICHVKDTGTDIYTYNGTTFTRIATYSGLKIADMQYKKIALGDINGDGKTDLAVSPNESYSYSTSQSIPVGTHRYCPSCGNPNLTSDYCNDCGSYVGYSDYCRECYSTLTYGCYYNGSYLSEKCCPNHGTHVTVETNTLVDNGSAWDVFYSIGSGFVKKSLNVTQVWSGDKFFLEDIDDDGMADLVKNANGSVSFYPSQNGQLGSQTNPNAYTWTASGTTFIPSVVSQPNYHSFLLGVKNGTLYKISYTGSKRKNTLLTGAINSIGVIGINDYGRLNEGYSGGSTYGTLYTKNSNAVFPYENFLGPLWVARQTETYWKDIQHTHQTFTYYNALIHKQGLGFQGFEKLYTYDNIRGRTNEQHFDPTRFGVPVKSISPTAKVENTFTVTTDSYKKRTVKLSNSKTTNLLTNFIVTHKYGYDSYNNMNSDSVDYGNIQTEIKACIYRNVNTSSEFVIGLPESTTTQRTRDGVTTSEREEIIYYPNYKPQTRKTYFNNNKTGETRWNYYPAGALLYEEYAPYSETDFLRTSYTYTTGERFIETTTDPLGLLTTFSNFTIYGQPQTVKDYKNNSTTYQYDILGRQTKVTRPDGVVESTSYSWDTDNGSSVYKVQSTATGQPAATKYTDAFGRETKQSVVSFSGQPLTVFTEYDTFGRLYRQSEPSPSTASRWTRYEYDGYDRPLTITAPSTRVTNYTYSGNSVKINDGSIEKTTFTDATGLTEKVTDAAGNILYFYRPDGKPKEIRAPGSAITKFEYDGFGRQSKLIDPSAGTITYGYDQWGNIKSQTDGTGKVQSMVYDKYGLIQTYSSPEMSVSYGYRAGDKMLETVTGSGSGSTTSKSYTYDNLLRTTSETENSNGVAVTLSYQYSNGKLQKVTYSPIASEPLEYLYNSYGYPSGLKLGANTIKTVNSVNNFGQATSATLGNGVVVTNNFDANGMPTLIKAEKNSSAFQNLGYSFNATTGRPEWRKDYRRGMTENFTFDNLERLKTYQNGSVTYDVKGNITLKSDAGNLYYNDPAKPYSITSQSNSPLPVRVQNISYTSFQRPLSIEENGCRADFVYGPGHNRVNMKLKTSPTTEFLRYYVAGCYEKDVNTLGAPGTTERLYIGGDAYSAPAVYIRTNSGAWQLHYLHRDVQGSITNITNSTGAEVAEYSYTAWGRMRNPVNWTEYTPGTEPALLTGRGYTGHEHLNMFRLINMNARLYDPVLGRMLSPDNYVQSPDFSQNFNRYAYCLNNPVMYTDLSGDRFAIAPGEQDLYINDTALDYRRMIGYGGPGSGNYWSDSFRSVTGNYMLMGSGTFDQTYGNGSYDMYYNTVVNHIGSLGYRNGVSGIWYQATTVGNQYRIGAPGTDFRAGFDVDVLSRFYEFNKPAGQGGGTNPYALATIGAIALAADDVTGIGAVDDIAIPFLYAAAATYDLTQRVFVTYTLTNASGQKYAGRASGFGDPYSVMMGRYASHHMKAFGYGNPTLDVWAQGAQAYPAIRGREQQLLDFYGGIGNVGNSIRGVGYYNPMGRVYHSASNLYFGPLAPYTGY